MQSAAGNGDTTSPAVVSQAAQRLIKALTLSHRKHLNHSSSRVSLDSQKWRCCSCPSALRSTAAQMCCTFLTAAYSSLLLLAHTPQALALQLHEDLSVARSLSSAAAAEKAEGLRRDLLLRLYGRVLEAPGLTLRDTFTYIVDTLYKVGCCSKGVTGGAWVVHCKGC